IYIMDSSGGGKISAEMLSEKGIKAVIYESEMSHLASEVFESYGIPKIHASEVEIMTSDEIAVVNSKSFEKTYERRLKELKERNLERLEKLFEDYKMRRLT
ncbi:MAG: DUF460 domain-containing protein, partial [Candidatus Methanomethylicota archaeon]